MHALLKSIIKIEFEQINYRDEFEQYFRFVEGSIPILLSAPHGARHKRNGAWKGEDEYTASIAVKLAEMTNAHVIYVKNQTQEDPNATSTSAYKEKIKKIIKDFDIKFLADIHGANSNRNFKICAGIIDEDPEKCSCPTFKPVIQDALGGFQSPLFNLEGLCAANPKRVTYFARHECGIESAQFEINADYRIIKRKPDSTYALNGMDLDFRADEQKVKELLCHMKKMILSLARISRSGRF